MSDTHSAATLIKKYFQAQNSEILALPSEDRIQLGSAIARELKLPVEQLNFTPVDY